jgi:hypothetical protein
MHVPYIKWLSIQVNGMVDYLHGIHEQVKKIITDSHAKYKSPSWYLSYESGVWGWWCGVTNPYSWQVLSGCVKQVEGKKDKSLWGIVKYK